MYKSIFIVYKNGKMLPSNHGLKGVYFTKKGAENCVERLNIYPEYMNYKYEIKEYFLKD